MTSSKNYFMTDMVDIKSPKEIEILNASKVFSGDAKKAIELN